MYTSLYKRITHTATILIISTVALSAITAGCQPPDALSDRLDSTAASLRNISVYQLADRLGMSVEQINDTNIQLSNSANSVLIFTYTGGQFYVNGTAKGSVGKIEKKNGSVFVSESLLASIRKALNQSSARTISQTGKCTGKVVLDAGHGGKDPGAISSLGFYEKEVNLKMVYKLARLLEQKGITVKMIRTRDRFVELDRRAQLANRYAPDLFVSIHADSAQDSSARGSTLYISNSASHFSNLVARKIIAAIEKNGIQTRGVHKADFRVLVGTRCPAVLVELGYLSNLRDASLLRTDSFLNKLALAIAEGICNSLSAK